jgi:hypothetical protein
MSDPPQGETAADLRKRARQARRLAQDMVHDHSRDVRRALEELAADLEARAARAEDAGNP